MGPIPWPAVNANAPTDTPRASRLRAQFRDAQHDRVVHHGEPETDGKEASRGHHPVNGQAGTDQPAPASAQPTRTMFQGPSPATNCLTRNLNVKPSIARQPMTTPAWAERLA